MKPATVKFSSKALKHNLKVIKTKAPNSKIIAVVKANAYGHGLEFVAKTVEQEADCFGVARLEEALRLRSSGIIKPILLLEGFFSPEDLPVLAVNNIQTVIHNGEQLKALQQAENLPHPIKVWLKVDTGMHRLGVQLTEVEFFYESLRSCTNVDQEIGFVSHFSRADELDSDYTLLQLDRFLKFTTDNQNTKKGHRTIAASGGILFWEQSHLEFIRPGIIMYGVSPINQKLGAEFDLKPVMTLTSSLIAVRDHKQGEPVGYSGTWIAPEDTKIGVVAIGYGDGYPRNIPANTPVYVNGRIVPIVGRVSMDMVTVDLGIHSKDNVGDEVILWGENLPVEKIAEHTGILSYELITKLTPRVLTEYID